MCLYESCALEVESQDMLEDYVEGVRGKGSRSVVSYSVQEKHMSLREMWG